jgi:crotonobetainyl-CoA:carnitine CoA-transferase CaiB-like acyl-CoA transferase
VGAGRFAIADELEALFAPRLLERTAEEWFALALERRLPFVVVPDIATLLSSPAHRRRGSFGEVEIAGRRFEAPRLPHNLTLTPPRRGGAAPRAGSAEPAWRSAKRPPLPCGKGAGLPLAGVRVVDLSMGWAGPLATRQLADLGAEIIKVEACQYPDWWRGNDARPETLAQKLYEKAPIFQLVNRNKTGITLDLTSPEGASLLKRLVAGADAVVENYSREVLPKLGLGYPALRAAKPDLVMVSMPAFGADHDWADCRAYGSTLEQASGLPSVSGEENWPPLLNHIAYGDAVGGMNAAAALLIALAHRDRTGEGQHIDLSQVECMLPFVAPWIIEQSLTGRVGPRTGSRHPVHAPHNVFRCAGEDAWIFVAVTGDAEWHSLCRAIGRPDLALDERLRDASGRRRHLAEIEAAVAAWTAERQADAAMDALQRAGVAAGVLRSPFRLTEDPHLAARGFWQIVDRPFVGAHAQPSAPWREGDRPYPVRRPAPMLGEHTRETLARLLGLGAAELDALEKRGVIGTEAAPASGRKSRAASS